MAMADRLRHTWGLDARGLKGCIRGVDFSFRVARISAEGDLDRLDCEVAPFPGEKPVSCEPETLRLFLLANGDVPVAVRARAAFEDALSAPGCLDLLARHPELARTQEVFYLLDRRRRGGRVATALRHPGLAVVLPVVVSRLHDRNGEPCGTTPRDLLVRYAPHALPGSLRSVLRMERAVPTIHVLDALLALPPERHPRGEAENEAFEAIAMTSRPVADLMGGQGHLASAAKEGWVAFGKSLRGRLAGAPDRDGVPDGEGDSPEGWNALGRACTDVRDVARAFARQVLAPLLHARGAMSEDRLLRLCGGGMADFNENDAAVTAVAARLLFAGKSLPAILELSARWHERQRGMDAAVEGLAARFPQPPGEIPRPGTWPVPFGTLGAPNGVEIAFLGSQEELSDEGAIGLDRNGLQGLGHCVSGYGSACASGFSAVASLRRRKGDGFERLSTAEVSVGATEVRVVQHRGKGNADVPRAARKALDWLVEEVAGKRMAPDEAYMKGGWRYAGGKGSLSGRCGYGHLVPGAVEAALGVWSPLLTRPLRDPVTLYGRGIEMLLALEEPERVRMNPALARLLRKGRASLTRFVETTLWPLKVGQWMADFLGERIPGFPTDVAAVAFGVAAEVAALSAINAVSGRAWAFVLALQLAVPVAVIAWSSLSAPGIVARTTRHLFRAVSLNAGHGRPAGKGPLASGSA